MAENVTEEDRKYIGKYWENHIGESDYNACFWCERIQVGNKMDYCHLYECWVQDAPCSYKIYAGIFICTNRRHQR